MPKAITFVFLFSGLSVTNRVRILSRPQLNPSPLLPVCLDVQINTKFLGLAIEVDLIVERIGYLLIVSSGADIYLDSTNTNRVLEHFAPNLDLVGVLVLGYLDDGKLTLRDEQHDGNS